MSGINIEDATGKTGESIYIEGYGYVDAETGELIELDGGTTEVDGELAEQDVEFILGKLFRLDGEIVAAEARLKAEQAAIVENWGPKVNRLKRAKESFVKWVQPALRAYAERALAKQNTKPDGTPVKNPTKSIKFPTGTLSFRAQNKVILTAPDKAEEERQAVEWLKANYAHALKIVFKPDFDKLSPEEIEVFKSVAEGKQTWEGAGWTAPSPIKVTLPGDKFDVKSGVK